MSKIYKNRLTIKSKDNNFLYKYIYNPYFIDFHYENTNYNGDLTFYKQFDNVENNLYNGIIKNMFSLTSELNLIDKSTFIGCQGDAQYVDFAYYNNMLVYQFVTTRSYPINWYKFIKLIYPELDFSYEYIICDELYDENTRTNSCFFINDIKNNIYKNLNEDDKSYKNLDEDDKKK